MTEAKHMPAVRCYTCGKVLCQIITRYHQDIEDGYTLEQARDRTGIPVKKFCCTLTIMVSHSPRQMPASAMFERQTQHYRFAEQTERTEPRHVKAD